MSDGGVVVLDEGTVVDVQSCNFSQNSADRGGSICVHSGNTPGSIIDPTNCNLFIDNVEIHEHFDTEISIRECLFYGNEASNSGGVFFADDGITLYVQNGTFIQNRANIGGVASVTLNSTTYFRDNSFLNNTAIIDGGVISLQMSSNVTVENSEFINNRALDDGAVVYADHRTNTIIRNNCIF